VYTDLLCCHLCPFTYPLQAALLLLGQSFCGARPAAQICRCNYLYSTFDQLPWLLLLLLLLQVTLLDPVRFPGAIKVFAREICRNDLLNFGRLHFFFPDSRWVHVTCVSLQYPCCTGLAPWVLFGFA
jgi:hypothetical protein